MKYTFTLICGLMLLQATAQNGYWQQHVAYKMDVEMDVKKHQFHGNQTLVYTNNSADTLRKVYFHLYFNAFQPGSMMDVRSRSIKDPDKRVGERIANLKEDEVGFQRIVSMTQNGKPLAFQTIGTMLEVTLSAPILPGAKTTFVTDFNAQVPIQIRRSGRNNKEDIDYTMTQWYPKMAMYDADGWHLEQYVAREFYGNFGSFDVKITLPTNYTVGGTGVLQQATATADQATQTWHFMADRVHDFAWAADPDFVRKSFNLKNGTQINLYYNPKTANVANWERMQPDVTKFFELMNAKFGTYTYPQFSIIQGGDGGMEYPMCTMILGGGKDYEGFMGLFAHEAAHNWYYGMLATNEQRYPWMDEGFTTFAEHEALKVIFNEAGNNAHLKYYAQYKQFDSLGLLVPLTTPADWFEFNFQYGINSYGLGELFLMQMQYIVGDDAFWRGMKMYYNRWAFKHPKPEDFIRVMEDASGLQLDWFLIGFTQLTYTADYGIKEVNGSGPNASTIVLEKIGKRQMPVDVVVTLKSGDKLYYTIPVLDMYGSKNAKDYTPQAPWPWVEKEYNLTITAKPKQIVSIQLDPLQRSCDVQLLNNFWEKE